MSLFKSSDPESAAQREAQKAEAQERKAAERAAREQREAEAEFRRSPAGQARTSYERGDQLFQVSFDLLDIKSKVVVMEGAYTGRRATDVSEIINSIVGEGWQFHTLSTAFVNEGEESRDKFLASGQQVAVRGRLVGTYVFVREGQG